jgi:hypothetical protein
MTSATDITVAVAPESPFETLLKRAPYSWLRERDIDLLLCAELHADGHLRRLFAERLGVSPTAFGGAWVSYAELAGETDVVVKFNVGDKFTFAFIENKIAANFQPDQGARYLERAKRWSATNRVARVATILFAPSHYMSKPGAEDFEFSISYEDATEALHLDNDPRAHFMADALKAGVEALRAGYVAVPDAGVTDVWQYCWRTSLKVAPKLNFKEPGQKPGQSTWFYFREAEGFAHARKRAVVVYKAERGQADLQFAGMSVNALLSISRRLLDDTMKVMTAAKSASIRIQVPVIDFGRSASEQDAAVIEGFAACERLRALFVEHYDHFMSNLETAK